MAGLVNHNATLGDPVEVIDAAPMEDAVVRELLTDLRNAALVDIELDGTNDPKWKLTSFASARIHRCDCPGSG